MKNRVLAVALSLFAASGATADITNPGFEDGLTGWTTSGTVAISTAAPAAPTEGTKCALLTAGTTSPAALAAFLGCTVDDLMVEAATATMVRNGAGLAQTFTVAEGDILQFSFSFNNAEDTNNEDWPDTAFVVINGEVHALASSASTPHGWGEDLTFSKGNLTAGTVTLGFAVCNFADVSLSSQLKIDKIQVFSNVVLHTCGAADVGTQGGEVGFDGRLDNNDFIAFIGLFFAHDDMADHGGQGGVPGADGQLDNNDFIVFIDEFFTGMGTEGCAG